MSLFPCSPVVFLSNRPLERFASGSSSRVFVSLQSTFVPKPARCISTPSPTCQGSLPIRGFTGEHPLNAGVTMALRRSALRLSQPLDGLLHPPVSRAYFIPQPRSGFFPFRGFSLHPESPSSSEGAYLHAVRTPATPHPKMKSAFGLFDFEALT